MSDMLTRLVARAQGSALCLRPRPRLRFAPAAPMMLAGDDGLGGAAFDEPAAESGAMPAPTRAVAEPGPAAASPAVAPVMRELEVPFKETVAVPQPAAPIGRQPEMPVEATVARPATPSSPQAEPRPSSAAPTRVTTTAPDPVVQRRARTDSPLPSPPPAHPVTPRPEASAAMPSPHPAPTDAAAPVIDAAMTEPAPVRRERHTDVTPTTTTGTRADQVTNAALPQPRFAPDVAAFADTAISELPSRASVRRDGAMLPDTATTIPPNPVANTLRRALKASTANAGVPSAPLAPARPSVEAPTMLSPATRRESSPMLATAAWAAPEPAPRDATPAAASLQQPPRPPATAAQPAPPSHATRSAVPLAPASLGPNPSHAVPATPDRPRRPPAQRVAVAGDFHSAGARPAESSSAEAAPPRERDDGALALAPSNPPPRIRPSMPAAISDPTPILTSHVSSLVPPPPTRGTNVQPAHPFASPADAPAVAAPIQRRRSPAAASPSMNAPRSAPVLAPPEAQGEGPGRLQRRHQTSAAPITTPPSPMPVGRPPAAERFATPGDPPAPRRSELYARAAATPDRAASPREPAPAMPTPPEPARPERAQSPTPSARHDAPVARDVRTPLPVAPFAPAPQQVTLPPPAPHGPSRAAPTPPADPQSRELHVDIGRIDIRLPAAAPRRVRAEPPPVRAKPRGGPDQ